MVHALMSAPPECAFSSVATTDSWKKEKENRGARESTQLVKRSTRWGLLRLNSMLREVESRSLHREGCAMSRRCSPASSNSLRGGRQRLSGGAQDSERGEPRLGPPQTANRASAKRSLQLRCTGRSMRCTDRGF